MRTYTIHTRSYTNKRDVVDPWITTGLGGDYRPQAIFIRWKHSKSISGHRLHTHVVKEVVLEHRTFAKLQTTLSERSLQRYQGK